MTDMEKRDWNNKEVLVVEVILLRHSLVTLGLVSVSEMVVNDLENVKHPKETMLLWISLWRLKNCIREILWKSFELKECISQEKELENVTAARKWSQDNWVLADSKCYNKWYATSVQTFN